MKKIYILLVLFICTTAQYTSGQVIYNGSTTALVNGSTWYTFGNSSFTKVDNPLSMSKYFASPSDSDSYVGTGNAHYDSTGSEASFGLYGNPSQSNIKLTMSGHATYPSNFEIRLRTLSGEEFTYFVESSSSFSFSNQTFTIPLTSFSSLTTTNAPTLTNIENFSNLTFVLGFYYGDTDLSFSVSNVTFVTSTPPCTAPTIPTVSATNNSICSDSSTTLSINSGSLNSATEWVWYSGSCGGMYVGSGASINVSPNASTTYYARGEGNCVTSGPCASVSIRVNPTIIPYVSISASDTTICSGTNVSFSASTENGGTNPVYYWMINDTSYGFGGTTPFYTNNQLKDGDTISVILNSSAACAVQYIVSSNIIMKVSPLDTPSVTISASDTMACKGSKVVFMAAPTNGGNNPIYTWEKNGQKVDSSSNSFYTDDTLAPGDNISVILYTSITCPTSTSIQSNGITLQNCLTAIINPLFNTNQGIKNIQTTNNGFIIDLNTPLNSEASLLITDAIGRELVPLEKVDFSNGRCRVNANYEAGIIIVRIVTPDATYSKKAFVTK